MELLPAQDVVATRTYKLQRELLLLAKGHEEDSPAPGHGQRSRRARDAPAVAPVRGDTMSSSPAASPGVRTARVLKLWGGIDRVGLAQLLARATAWTCCSPLRGELIPGSYWGRDRGPGLQGARTCTRAWIPRCTRCCHEASHFICMTPERRAQLDRDAGGDDDEGVGGVLPAGGCCWPPSCSGVGRRAAHGRHGMPGVTASGSAARAPGSSRMRRMRASGLSAAASSTPRRGFPGPCPEFPKACWPPHQNGPWRNPARKPRRGPYLGRTHVDAGAVADLGTSRRTG